MVEKVWLGLGSNQGDRLGHLRFAVGRLDRHPSLDLVAVSPVYETGYVGPGRQADFLNAVVLIESRLEPEELLMLVKEWERERGRAPDGHMQPRPLDVDILLHGDRVLRTEGLEIPHPRLKERLFVLIPLCDLSPDKNIPNSGETVADLCAKIRRKCDPGHQGGRGVRNVRSVRNVQSVNSWPEGLLAPGNTGPVMEE